MVGMIWEDAAGGRVCDVGRGPLMRSVRLSGGGLSMRRCQSGRSQIDRLSGVDRVGRPIDSKDSRRSCPDPAGWVADSPLTGVRHVCTYIHTYMQQSAPPDGQPSSGRTAIGLRDTVSSCYMVQLLCQPNMTVER